MATAHEVILPVYTPLGRGKIVHTFPDGTVAVEFDHGGGHIFFPQEVGRVAASGLLGVSHPCRPSAPRPIGS